MAREKIHTLEPLLYLCVSILRVVQARRHRHRHQDLTLTLTVHNSEYVSQSMSPKRGVQNIRLQPSFHDL